MTTTLLVKSTELVAKLGSRDMAMELARFGQTLYPKYDYSINKYDYSIKAHSIVNHGSNQLFPSTDQTTPTSSVEDTY